MKRMVAKKRRSRSSRRTSRRGIRSQTIQLAKHLDPKEARRRASNRATRDWRGFKYNPRTGVATLI
jgi:hypothetical protein